MLERLTASRPWLRRRRDRRAADHRHRAGYDVVVMGADKWAQVRDPAWYDGSVAARDAALARLARVLVAPRPGLRGRRRRRCSTCPSISARCRRSAARAGNHDLIAPECRPAERLIVDGNNVIGSRPDGWWRDRAGRRPAAGRVAAGARARGAATGSPSCSTAVRSPTFPKACTTACSSRTRRVPVATPPTTASSRRSPATAIRRRSSSSRPTGTRRASRVRSAPTSRAPARSSPSSTRPATLRTDV